MCLIVQLALPLFFAPLLAPLVLKAAETIINSIGMNLVRVEAGSFTIGQDGAPLEDYLR